MNTKNYYVYLMTNKRFNVLYTGVTNNLIRRVIEHKSKVQDGFTKKYNVQMLVYFEEYIDIQNAILREKQIKSWSRKKKDNLVNSLNPTWKDLFEGIL